MPIKQSFISKYLVLSAAIPIVFLVVMWGVFAWEHFFSTDFTAFGLYPRDFKGLRGILFMPFIHGDFNHLVNNSIPFFFLGSAIFYFYPKTAFKVWIYILILKGLWLWVGGRQSFHIGASGLVYGFAFFLFFSGLFNKNRQMLGLSLLISFVYGSMVWGIFPIKHEVSWEGHLFGALAGTVLAYIYRKEGPQRKIIPLDEGIDILEEKFGKEYWMPSNETSETPTNSIKVIYTYVEKNKTNNDSTT